MPTRNQIIVIQEGRRSLGLNDEQYRMLLMNVANVDSSKLLTNTGVEDVMAVMEGMGFASHPAGATYWRGKVATRGTVANARLVYKVLELAPLQRYDLGAQILKFTGGRTELAHELRPHEAWQLIEMLKAAGAREAREQRAAAEAVDR